MTAAELDQSDPRWGMIEEGLLSPLIEEWRLDYLSNHSEWFELAREVNRCAVWLHQEHFEAGNKARANDQAPTAVKIYSRALNAYAAAVILAERALAIEAAGAVRPRRRPSGARGDLVGGLWRRLR